MDKLNGKAGSHQTNLQRRGERGREKKRTQLAQTEQLNQVYGVYLLQWVHAQTLVHARRVGQDGSQYRFEHETEVEGPVSHALVENRVTASLTDDQIGPLYDDDRHEERGVAGELEGLAIAVGLRARGDEIRNGLD